MASNQSRGDLVNRITRECPTRIWCASRRRRLTVPDPPLGDERKYVIQIPLEWWEELVELLGAQDGD